MGFDANVQGMYVRRLDEDMGALKHLLIAWYRIDLLQAQQRWVAAARGWQQASYCAHAQAEVCVPRRGLPAHFSSLRLTL